MNVKIIYYCYIIYLIFHFVFLSCDIFTGYQISQTLVNALTVYQKQDKKSWNRVGEFLLYCYFNIKNVNHNGQCIWLLYKFSDLEDSYMCNFQRFATLSEAECTSLPWLTGFLLWFTVGYFHCRRASFYACRLDKHLYVIGGRNETGYLSSVECYNLETNEWRYVSSLPQPLAAHAGAVHNGKIYISGKSFLHFLLQSSVPRHVLDLYVYV